nr:hypothetical protein [Aeromonas veronii]
PTLQAEIERLNQEQAIALERRKHDFESEMANKQMSFDAAMEVTRNALHQRECALSEQESVVVQRSQNLDLQLAELASKEKALAKI